MEKRFFYLSSRVREVIHKNGLRNRVLRGSCKAAMFAYETFNAT